MDSPPFRARIASHIGKLPVRWRGFADGRESDDTMLRKIESNRRSPRHWTFVRFPTSRYPASVVPPDPWKGALDMKILVAILVALAMVGMAGLAAAQSEEGTANFYGDKFQGKKTASGAVFDKDGLTAAHKKLPFGTKVKVTNVENGKSVVVTVNDRMAASNPAVIDVTHRAADELGFASAGKAKVKVEVQK